MSRIGKFEEKTAGIGFEFKTISFAGSAANGRPQAETAEDGEYFRANAAA